MNSSRFTLSTPPETLCILRLSALGDITHSLPVLRTLQKHWPKIRISWIIGKTEYELVREIDGVEFIIFDKSLGFAAYPALRRALGGRKFDVLLHMQLSLRASIASLFIPAQFKLGFDRARAKDLQWLFTRHRIEPASIRQHVVDSFLEFPAYFGLPAEMQWQLPVPDSAASTIQQKLPAGRDIAVINACALAKSRDWRDWTEEGYAKIADHLAEQHGLQVVLSGGPSPREREKAESITALCQHKPQDLVGKTSIAELVALLAAAKLVIAPDTGPAHIANAVNTPVIGLYATTNPDRAGPYRFRQYVVNRYPQALKHFNQLEVEVAPWGTRVHNSAGMAMITADEVKQMVDRVLEE